MRFPTGRRAYVAHYTSAEIALDFILKDNRLRLGPLAATNDPRESKAWSFALTAKAPDPRLYWRIQHWVTRLEDFDPILRAGCRVLCVSRDRRYCPSYLKPRMWAQYAKNHTGVCLVFDRKVLHESLKHRFKQQNELISGAVRYSDFVPGDSDWADHDAAFQLSIEDLSEHGLEFVLRRHRDKHIKIFFFSKTKDWQSECEYRWIVRGKGNEPLYVPLDRALYGIVLGVDFPVDRLADARAGAMRMGVRLSRMLWDNGIPYMKWYEPKELADPECLGRLAKTTL